jgi:uncharacterized protein (TIRG00374 family)
VGEKVKRNPLFGAIKLGLKFAFAFGIVAYMVYSGRLDLEVVRKGFSNVNVLVASAGLLVMATLAALYRWDLLMRGQDLNFPFGQVARYGMIGAFFNTTMPGAVSGDLIKAWYVLSDVKGQKKTPVLTSILLDRIMGVFGLILVSASPLFLYWPTVWAMPQLRQVALLVLVLFAGMIFFFGYIMLSVWGPLAQLRRKMDGLGANRAGTILLQAYDAWVSYRKQPSILLRALLLAVFTHLCVVSVVFICARALGDDHLQLYQFMLLVPIGLITTAIPVAPAGLGVGHVAFAALFGMAGSKHGAEVFTMLVTVQILLNMTGIFFYLRSPKIVPEQVAEI